MRNPSIAITTYVVQLVAYPMGLLWDVVMPDRQFVTFGIKWNLKPGSFNKKEHTVIVVMANAAYAGGSIYATDTLLAQIVFYKQNFGWGFQILFALTTQMLGYGLAGISRRFLVWPAAAIWPSNLVNASLFTALHDHSASDPLKTNGWRIGRYRLFLYVFIGGFIWYFFPGWIFQGLSYFVFPTWIAPNNVVVNQLFGGDTGLGLIPITFDWTVVTGYLYSPMIPPWFATANTLIGLLLFVIIPALGIHYSGAWYSDYFPMQDSSSYDNTGSTYNVSKILTNYQFDEAKYQAYSPIFLSTNFALCYGISFAAIAAVVVHTALYHGQEIVTKWKAARNQEDDVHMRLMKKYDDAPDWWYVAVFVLMVALSFVTVSLLN
jgi:OPT family small oligopeptide transporter